MFAQRVLFSFITAAPLILMPSGGQAQATDKPPVIEALEDQGVTFKQEFDAGEGVRAFAGIVGDSRSEEHTSELQSLMRNSYAVFCLKKKQTTKQIKDQIHATQY